MEFELNVQWDSVLHKIEVSEMLRSGIHVSRNVLTLSLKLATITMDVTDRTVNFEKK